MREATFAQAGFFGAGISPSLALNFFASEFRAKLSAKVWVVWLRISFAGTLKSGPGTPFQLMRNDPLAAK